MANRTYIEIVRIAEQFMQNSGNTSQDKAIKSRDLVNHIQDVIETETLDIEVARSTIFAYVSHAANQDEASGIVSGGAWGGYWYDKSATEVVSTKPVEEAQISSSSGSAFQFSERDLYPLINLWLSTKGFITKDVSNLKSGGKWGNPDVLGAKRVELLGAVDIEIASCEVKLSESNWEQFIFEAISHKRFSNRSWFVYRVAQSGKPLPKAIEYYAERYKVGIIQIFLSDDDLSKLKSSKADTLEEFIDRVNERVPALYEHVPLQEKAELFDRAKISAVLNFQ